MTKDKRAHISQLLRVSDWTHAREAILRELRKSPDDAWLLMWLGRAYFQEGEYKKALKASKKAYGSASRDPVVLWDCARALYMTEQTAESIALYRRILRRKPEVIAEKMGWDERKGKGFLNDCRFEIALCYIQIDKLGLAIRWMKAHLSKRRPGMQSNFSIDSVRRHLRRVSNLKRKVVRSESRLWISLLEVEILKKDKRIKYRRGFTTGLVMARSAEEAEDCLGKALADWDYRLLRADGTEEYARRLLKSCVADEVNELASHVRKTKAPQFDTFHMYPCDPKKR